MIFQRRTMLVLLHDCEDCEYTDGKKCTQTGSKNQKSTDCELFKWRKDL